MQELPHRLLLVALPPGQLLRESRVSQGAGGKRLDGNLFLPSPIETQGSPKFWALLYLPLRHLNGTP